jgi:6-phosphogluconolactonase
VYDAEQLGAAVVKDFLTNAEAAIKKAGAFYCAVPGGSVLKMLGGLKEHKNDLDFSKIHMFYANHKCVPNDDGSATHFKAKGLFLDVCPIHAYPIAETVGAKGHDTDAHEYAKAMKSVLPQSNGLPIFDYMLLGMGKDGHIGSLYPDRPEVFMAASEPWVLTVDKKQPSSITLSLPVMNAAREVRVVLAGGDKAEAVLAGVSRTKAAAAFPACGIAQAKWMIDGPAAALLESKGIVTKSNYEQV